MINPQRAEDCRFIVRKILYGRPTASMPVDAIAHHAARLGESFEPAELQAAADFLAGLEPAQVKRQPSNLGGSMRYQITSMGVLAYERNE